MMELMDTNANKGPEVHLLDASKDDPQVFKFDSNQEFPEVFETGNEVKQPMVEVRRRRASADSKTKADDNNSRRSNLTASPARVTSDDVLVIRRGDVTQSPGDDVTISPRLVLKAVLLVAMILGATYCLYWYSMNYSKSSEVLATLFLLLLTVYVFEPKYFLPSLIWNSMNPNPAAICSKPEYHTQ